MTLDFLETPARQAGTLREVAHRPWPPPAGGWAQAQTWEQLLFAHWRVPIEALRAHLPPGLEVDTFGGEAYVGITPFRVTGLRLRGLPPLPLVSSFLEVNCRTYVSLGGEKPGIWFFSLDASSRLAVEGARRLYRLPYFRASMTGPPSFSSVRVEGGADRVLEATYRPAGDPAPAEPATLENFLTERYCLYTADATGALHRAEIHHPPWLLAAAHAAIRRNSLLPEDLEVEGEPHVLYAERQDVVIWPLERVE